MYPIPKMAHVDLPESVNAITGSIVDSAITVQRELGPGLLENIYQDALAFELRSRGHEVAREVRVPVVYRGVTVGHPLQIDLLVDDTVIVECKAVGLLINFLHSHLWKGSDAWSLRLSPCREE